MDECTDDSKMFTKECSYEIMGHLEIDTKSIDRCVTYAETRNYKIPLFDSDRELSKKLGIILQPTVTINNITYRGEIDGIDVFKAICAGFLEQPDICRGDKIYSTLDEVKGDIMYTRRSVVRMYHIIAAIVLVLLLNFGALYIYRKMQKKKMNEELQLQVNSAVSQYFKLSGTD